MAASSLSSLTQSSAENVGLQFLKQFYGCVTTGSEKLTTFYSRHAEVVYPNGQAEGAQIKEAMKEMGLVGSFIDLSKGSIKIIPLFAQGILVQVSGLVKKEKDEKEVHCDFHHRLILLPEVSGKTATYFIVNELLDFGKEKTIEPPKKVAPVEKKKPEPKKQAPVVKKTQPPPQQPKKAVAPPPPEKAAAEPIPSKPSSYASALQTKATKPEPIAKKVAVRQSPPPAAPKAPVEKPEGFLERSLFVKGIPAEAVEDDLKNLFNSHGKVTRLNYKAEGRNATVEFDSSEPVSKFLSLPPKERSLKLMVNGKEFELTLWKREASGKRPAFKPRQ